MNWERIVRYCSYIVFLFEIFIIAYVLIKSVSAYEKVSLSQLDYEIVEDNPYDGIHTKYETADTYYSYDFDNGYYLLDDDVSVILCDTLFFNYTNFDKFYINYYVDDDVISGFNLTFRYSFTWGNLGDVYYRLCDKENIYMYMREGDDDLSDWSNSQMSFYHNDNNKFMWNTKSFDSYPSLDIEYDAYYLNDISETIFLENGINDYSIEIKNNFDYAFHEMHKSCQIILDDVDDDLYITDYGFISNSIEHDYNINDNYTYYRSFDNSLFMVDAIPSDDIHSDDSEYYQDLFLTAYDGNNIYNVMYQFSTDDISGTWDCYDLYIGTHNDYDIFHDRTLLSHYLNVANFYDDYSDNGIVIFANKNSCDSRVKTFFNILFNIAGYQHNIELYSIYYEKPKSYYGFAWNNTVWNCTISKLSNDVIFWDNPKESMDSWENLVEINQKSYEINGDWGIVDGLRKSINIIIGVLYEIIIPIYSSIDSVISEIGLIPANIFSQFDFSITSIISNIQNVGSDVFNEFESILDSIDTALGNIPSNVFNAFESTLNDIIDGLADIVSGLSSIVDLLTLLGFVQTIIGLIETFGTQLINFYTNIITFLAESLTSLFDLFSFIVDVLPQIVEIWLSMVFIVTLIKIYSGIQNDDLDLSESLRFFVEGFIMPIVLIGKFFIKIIELTLNAIPF